MNNRAACSWPSSVERRATRFRDGFVAVSTIHDAIESVAVGEFGTGILGRSRRGVDYDSDGEAIKAAVETNTSGWNSTSGARAGAAWATWQLTSERLRGYLIVQWVPNG